MGLKAERIWRLSCCELVPSVCRDFSRALSLRLDQYSIAFVFVGCVRLRVMFCRHI